MESIPKCIKVLVAFQLNNSLLQVVSCVCSFCACVPVHCLGVFSLLDYPWGTLSVRMQQFSSSIFCFVEEFSLVLDFFSTPCFLRFSEKSGRSNFRSSVQEEFSEKCLWF